MEQGNRETEGVDNSSSPSGLALSAWQGSRRNGKKAA